MQGCSGFFPNYVVVIPFGESPRGLEADTAAQ